MAGIGVFSLTREVTKIIGAQYSRKQESEADDIAVLWLELEKGKHGALSRALARLQTWQESHHIDVKRSFSDSHPELASRIDSSVYIDDNFTQYDPSYSRTIHRALVNTASYELANNSPRLALKLLNRATESGHPTSIGLALKANASRKIGKATEKELIEMVSAALLLDPSNTLALTESTLLSIRTGDITTAKVTLEKLRSQYDVLPPWIVDLEQQLE